MPESRGLPGIQYLNFSLHVVMGFVNRIEEKIVSPVLGVVSKEIILTEEHAKMESVKMAKIVKPVH